MALQYVWIGSAGPLIYEDGDAVPDPQLLYDGAAAPNQAGLATSGQLNVLTAPVLNPEVLRLEDVGVLAGDVFGDALGVDERVVRFDTDGYHLQNSLMSLNDAGHITSFGGNITFPGAQVASADVNTLDDYEEGYYTATLVCGTSGTITLHADADQLAYTKVGRLVTVTGYIYVSAINLPVGDLTLNLPFSIAALNENAEYFAGSVSYNNIVAIGTAGSLVLVGAVGAVAYIRELTTTGQLSDVANHIKATSNLSFGFSYFTT